MQIWIVNYIVKIGGLSYCIILLSKPEYDSPHTSRLCGTDTTIYLPVTAIL